MATKITGLNFVFLTATERDYLATWKFGEKHVDHYEVEFQYYAQTANAKKNSKGKVVKEWKWISGGTSNVTAKQATYSAPENASSIRVRVKPVSAKTHKVGKKKTTWWTGSWSGYKEIQVSGFYVPDSPSTPTVTIEDSKLVMRVDNLDSICDQVKFEIITTASNNKPSSSTKTATPYKLSASVSINTSSGCKYRVRARCNNKVEKTVKKKKQIFEYWSEWSEFSGDYTAIPAKPGKPTLTPKSEASVLVSWAAASGASTYEIGYANTTEELTSQSGSYSSQNTSDTSTKRMIDGLEAGKKWYFRVRAVNDSGNSPWSDTASTILGTKPAAPTTWSSATVASKGEAVTLYWVHNSEDGSTQSGAEIAISVNGQAETYIKDSEVIKDPYGNPTEETRSHKLDTGMYEDGTEILWRVRTKGIVAEWSDWSIQRSIKVYEEPQVMLDVIDPETENPVDSVTSFPVSIRCAHTPESQKPIGYGVGIIANGSYETVSDTGMQEYIIEGTEVYRQYFDTNEDLLLQLSAGDVDFQNGVSYTVSCVAAFDSGLSAEGTTEFEVAWEDEQYELDAVVEVNSDDLTAMITPVCYIWEDLDLDADGFNDSQELELAQDVTLSVYRREANGRFTEIETGIEDNGSRVVTDPHPSLDYARYRIVAKSKSTGAVSYDDIPGFPVEEAAIVIQWDEEWVSFNSEEENGEPAWTGSMVKLPYNIDVSEDNSVDVNLVKYIGRERPVSYYGTQLGEKSTWNTEIPKDDEETVYALRRLAAYMGDVYVREPSGLGYWAQVSVSMSRKHCEMTIPVTINVTPVEGGM